MRQYSGPRLPGIIHPLIAIGLCLLLSSVSFAQQARALMRVTTSDATDKPVAGVLVEVKLKGSVAATGITNEKGETEFVNLAPGGYEVVVSKETFEPLTQSDVALTAGGPIEIKFTMIPRVQLRDVVN